MTPYAYLEAARVPVALEPQTFGPWTIHRHRARTEKELNLIGWPWQTRLERPSWATLHLDRGEIVMEDSVLELSKHLPIWLAAKGTVLITGLGLGCVVRGLLASAAVEHIDVVEIDDGIVRVVGPEFAHNARVTIHRADALEWDKDGAKWDYAWHDLWTDGDDHLQTLHMRLMKRFHGRVKKQGAWAFPRYISKRAPHLFLGAPGYMKHMAAP